MKLPFGFRIQWRCGCGLINYNLEDWLCHFRARGFKRGFINLIKTRPVFGRGY